MRPFRRSALAAIAVIGFASVASAAPPPPVWSWTGFYIGANAGYSWAKSSSNWNIFAANPGGATACTSPASGSGNLCLVRSGTSKLNGATGGFQAGYNWQIGEFLAGIETDFQISGEKADDIFTTLFPTDTAGLNAIAELSQSEKIAWLGTLRGRVGVTFNRWLLYSTAGLAYGRVKLAGGATATGGVGLAGCTATGCPFQPLGNWSDSHTKVGWTLGAGIEGAVTGNWTVKLEYLYVDLGKFDTTFATLPNCYGNSGPLVGTCANANAGVGTIHTKVTDNIVRIGLNYKFGN